MRHYDHGFLSILLQPLSDGGQAVSIQFPVSLETNFPCSTEAILHKLIQVTVNMGLPGA
jgi:hypothetical protein